MCARMWVGYLSPRYICRLVSDLRVMFYRVSDKEEKNESTRISCADTYVYNVLRTPHFSCYIVIKTYFSS